MGKRETRTVRTAKRRLAGHVSTGPSGVPAQSKAAISRPASPPAAKISLRSGPDGESGTTLTSSRLTHSSAPALNPFPGTGSEPFDHVVDAGGQRAHVVGVDGGEHADPELVAAQLPIGL